MLKHRWLLLLACAVGLGSFTADQFLIGAKLGFVQMLLCTILVFGIVGIIAGKSLARPRQAGVAVALMAFHLFLLLRLATWFPLPNMVIGISGAAFESLILIFLFARLGQTIDPEGPYGLTAAEIKRKQRLEERLHQSLGKNIE